MLASLQIDERYEMKISGKTLYPYEHIGIHTHGLLTINAPLILKVREIICFSRAKHIMGHFEGFFEGAETFLTLKLF
jgi:hypothetical protein